MKGIRQHDIKDCGAACIASVLRYYKSYVPMVKIREYMHIDRNGASIYAMVKTADHFGLKAEGYEGTVDEIRNDYMTGKLSLPLIAHIVTEENYFHYIIIEKINGQSVNVFDPYKGNQRYSIDKFSQMFTGYFITIKPKADFVPIKKTFKPFVKFTRIILQQKRLFTAAIFFSAILAVLSILCSFAYQLIIDRYIIESGQVDNLKNIPVFSKLYSYLEIFCQSLPKLFFAVLAIYIIQNLIFAMRGIIITFIYKNSSKMLITDYCRTMIRLPIPFFHDRETGEILSRYNDIEELQNIISGIGLSIIMDILMAVAGGIVLFYISSQLFGIITILTLIYAVIVFFYRKPMRNISRRIMEADSQLTSKLKETIDGIESIKSSCAEVQADKKLQEKTDEYIDAMKAGSLISLSQSAVLGIAQSIGSLLMLYAGCMFILNDTITLGAFISFETLVYFFMSPIQNFMSMQITLQQAFVSADRLNDILENTQEKEIFNGTDDYSEKEHLQIEVKNLQFAYGFRDPVLTGISFSAKSKEKIAITGKSGCGKTTLLHILGMLETGYQGTVRLNGKDIKNFDVQSYRNNVIYISQESIIFAESIRENILMGTTAPDEKLDMIIKGCELQELVNENIAGLDRILEEGGKDLSGGQRQRIAIARALIRDPQVLLLDESTSHLDSETEKRIFEFMARNFPDTICMFSTHKKNLIDMCDRKLQIVNGYIE